MSSAVTVFGATSLIGVLQPVNTGKLGADEVDALWATLETEARKAVDACGRYRLVDRGVLNGMLAEADVRAGSDLAVGDGSVHKKLAKIGNVSYVLASSIGAFREGKYVLTMTVIDCASGEHVNGSRQNRSFLSMDELVAELEYMVRKCINCVSVPPLSAVLRTVVLNPTVPAQYGEAFQKTLSGSLLQSGIRLVLGDEVQRVLRAKGIDDRQSLPAYEYAKVAESLHAGTLVLSQITTCRLQAVAGERWMQPRRQKYLAGMTGVIAGCIQVVDGDGGIRKMIPFENYFDFNSMESRGELDQAGWDANRYCLQMMDAVVSENMAELLKGLK